MHGISFKIVMMYNSGSGLAVTNGAGVATHSLLNNVLVEYALPITIGTVIGVQIGCSLAARTDEINQIEL